MTDKLTPPHAADESGQTTIPPSSSRDPAYRAMEIMFLKIDELEQLGRTQIFADMRSIFSLSMAQAYLETLIAQTPTTDTIHKDAQEALAELWVTDPIGGWLGTASERKDRDKAFAEVIRERPSRPLPPGLMARGLTDFQDALKDSYHLAGEKLTFVICGATVEVDERLVPVARRLMDTKASQKPSLAGLTIEDIGGIVNGIKEDCTLEQRRDTMVLCLKSTFASILVNMAAKGSKAARSPAVRKEMQKMWETD
ncbi:MAG: hypothetical protein Q9227_007048 [Pyrenula ochraceoflavens]